MGINLGMSDITISPAQQLDFLHYLLVFSIILSTWLPLMFVFETLAGPGILQIILTSMSSFIIFVVADKITHKVLGI